MTRAAILVEQNWNAVPGGTARSINALVEALVEHSSIELIGFSGRHGRAPVLELPRSLELTEVPFPGRLLVQTWNRLRAPSIDRWIDADVVHAPAYVVPKTSSPVVVTIHDLAFVRHPEWFTSHGAGFFDRFLAQVVRNDAAVIVPSSITADDCVRAGIDDDRITVIPWGISPLDVDAAEAEAVRVRHGLPESFVLFVGTLEPRKNLRTLAAAMTRLERPEPLVVIGPDGWGDITVPGARLLGEVSSPDVAALMAGATALVYPSHFEGFGLPVLEAMAQGTPVVVTEGTSPADIAQGGGLAVDTRNVGALAGAIESLLDDEALRSSLGTAGRRRAGHYDWRTTAEATVGVYRSLAR